MSYFKVDPLPYSYSALEPHLSSELLTFHYDKHHLGYAAKLNTFAEKMHPEIRGKSLLELIKTTSGGVFNCAAQIWNHTFYWNSMCPPGSGRQAQPGPALRSAIERDFGSMEAFTTAFSNAAVGHFGSGWAWLLFSMTNGKLSVDQTHDALTPAGNPNCRAILCCDVWEHAYYIDFRNDRAKYVTAWWALVNWKFADLQYKAALAEFAKNKSAKM